MARQTRQRRGPSGRVASKPTPTSPPRGSLRSTTEQQLPQNQKSRVLVSIDLGTSTYSAGFNLLRPGETIVPWKIGKVVFTANGKEDHICPMIAAWHDGRWYVGRNVEAHASIIPSHKLMRNFKLLFYDPHQNSLQARRVQKQLKAAGKSSHELLREVIQYIWNDASNWIGTRLRGNHIDMEQCETFVYFCVPILVTFDGTKQLKAAAKEAGVPRCGFVYEPMGVAACIIEHTMREAAWDGRLSALSGSTALVLDCGGGTSDVVLIKLTPCIDRSEHSRIEVVQPPDGILCGSSSIDLTFQRWLKAKWNRERQGGFTGVITQLGLASEEHLLEKATNSFRSHKNEMSMDMEFFEREIVVRPKRGTAGGGITEPLDFDTMASFFDDHLNEIFALVRRNLSTDTKVILLSGGLSANQYFRERLKENFNPRNSNNGIEIISVYDELKECPVARGALMVEDALDQKNVTVQTAGGLLNTSEKYNRKIHTDAISKDGDFNPDIVFPDLWESELTGNRCLVVEDRIKWLIKPNSKADVHGNFESRKCDQMFYILVEEPTVTYITVTTSKTQLKDHEPLYEPDRTTMLEGFDTQTSTFLLDGELVQRFKDNRQIRWLSPGNDDNDKPLPKQLYLKLYCRFAMKHDNKSLEVGMQVLAPEQCPYKANGGRKKRADFNQLDNAHWIELRDADFDTRVHDCSIPVNNTPSLYLEEWASPRRPLSLPSASSPKSTSSLRAHRSGVSSGGKRKYGKGPLLPSARKRGRRGPEPMSGGGINARSGPSSVSYETLDILQSDGISDILPDELAMSEWDSMGDISLGSIE